MPFTKWGTVLLGMAFSAAGSSLLFVVNDHTKIEHVSTQQIADEDIDRRAAEEAARERHELLEEVRMGFDRIDRRLDGFGVIEEPARRPPTRKAHPRFQGDVVGPANGLEK